jgi:tRNA nucleotidyltransferase (CCA-adding enzyme)
MGRTHPIHSVEHVLERLPALPGGAELIAAARQRADIALVGGAVRDLLLGHWPRELDVTVERDAAGLARALAASVSPSERAYGHAIAPTLHGRFGTASVRWDYGRIDIAERRAESYAAPGALPDVRAGTIEQDLARRDFTVNAITLPLAGPGRGELRHVDGALEDLRAGVLRTLHDGSFGDDPTRVLRLARYSARLGFEIDAHTRELARAAVAAGAFATVSGGRIGAELWLAAGEADGAAAFALLGELGALAALGLSAPFAAELARDALAELPEDGARDVLLIALAFAGAHPGDEHAAALAERMTQLEFTREQLKAVLEAATLAEEVAAQVRGAASDAAAYAALDGRGVELVAIAAALAGRQSQPAARRLREWLATQRHVALQIDGRDLIAAGVSEGPEVGARLAAALGAKREGAAPDRDAELAAALGAEPATGPLAGTGRAEAR